MGLIPFHNFVEGSQLALHGCLKPFFIDGGTFLINDYMIKFPPCRIVFNIRELEDDTSFTFPIIGILGSGGYDTGRDYKCEQSGPVYSRPSFIRYIELGKSVYVKVRKSGLITDDELNSVNSAKFADRAWSLLNLFFKTQSSVLSENKLRLLSFTDFPTDMSNANETLLYGRLKLIAETTYRKE